MTFQHAPVPVAQAQPHLLAARQADFEAVEWDPSLAEHQAKTTRQFPVIALSRRAS